jgi:FAD/FMN-containing dehydrogenase
VQGGVLTSTLIERAYAHGVLIPTGTCNSVGVAGALLGGGVGCLMGQYGFMLDNVVSFNVVLPSGEFVTVTPDTADLWWALRGAGPNFGAVTSFVMKSYPVNSSRLDAWMGPLIFTESQLEQLIQAMNDLTLEAEMAMTLTFLNSSGPSPLILLAVFYHGTASQGKTAFAPIYAIGPVVDKTMMVPFTQWNAALDPSCAKGGNKPAFGAGLANLRPETWRAVYNEYKNFVSRPEGQKSVIILNAYSTAKTRTFPDSVSSYPFRSTIRFNAQASLAWTNSTFGSTALAFGSTCRDLWRLTSGLDRSSTYDDTFSYLLSSHSCSSNAIWLTVNRYINNALGDESLRTVYGDSLERLQTLKNKYDPYRRFNYWFPLDGF